MNFRLPFFAFVGACGFLWINCSQVDTTADGLLRIRTEPPGCSVYVNSELQPDTTPCDLDSIKIEEGAVVAVKRMDYSLRLKNTSYGIDSTWGITVTGPETVIIDTFCGELTVRARDENKKAITGSLITLDNKETYDSTPHTYKLFAGVHTVVLEKDSFAISVDTAIVKCSEEDTLSVVMRHESVLVPFNCRNIMAEIWVDDVFNTTTKFTSIPLPLGNHTVKVKNLVQDNESIICTVYVAYVIHPTPIVEVFFGSEYGEIHANSDKDYRGKVTLKKEDGTIFEGIAECWFENLVPGRYYIEYEYGEVSRGATVIVKKGLVKHVYLESNGLITITPEKKSGTFNTGFEKNSFNQMNWR